MGRKESISFYKGATREQMRRARILRAEQNSAKALIRANILSEKGQRGKAEELYQLSARHLMRANDLIEGATR